MHYIELWADRNPEIEEINLKIEEPKKIPTVDDPKWTGNFKDDPEEILLTRLVFGEARNQPQEAKIWITWSVINRIEAKAWPNTLYEVILQPKQYDPFKPTDLNYSKIIDPLREADFQTIQSWKECYKIAKIAVNKEIENPTLATHFHGIGVSMEWFEKNVVPNGNFLKKIGDTYFYWSPN
ncbi:MAG: cell wall hydrolase [Candidatus Kuenenbacteria bacterium]